MKITTEKNLDVTIVRIEGRLDAAAVSASGDELKSLAKESKRWMLLNVEGIEFVDSSGLGLLVSLTKEIRQNDGEIVITNLSPQVKMLFDLTRMTQVFTIHENEQDALDAIQL